MKTDSGFTAIELLVTIAVAAILLSLAVPGFSNLISSNRISAQTNEFVAAASFARTEAIKRGSPVIVCRSTEALLLSDAPECVTGTGGWESGWIVFSDDNGDDVEDPTDGDGELDEDEQILRTRGPFGNAAYSIRGNNPVANRLIFTDQGMTRTPGSFTICNDKRPTDPRFVILSTPGRMRVLTPETLQQIPAGSRPSPPACPPA